MKIIGAALVAVTLSAVAVVAAGRETAVTVPEAWIGSWTPLGRSALELGFTHAQVSIDAAPFPGAAARASAVAARAGRYQNQHLMGWGALSPAPSPGERDWSTLDARIGLIRRSGGEPVLTLCCAPDWMKGGQPGGTDWARLEDAPLPEHEASFAALAAEAVRRYPDVRHVLVWNELKGFYDPVANRWDAARYTRLYNAVYDAVKAVDPGVQVGGPYVVMDSWADASTASHPSEVAGPWGVLDQRALDVVGYWLANAHGADFVVVDGTTATRDRGWVTDPFTALGKVEAVNRWLRERTPLPIWWAEWYPIPDDVAPGTGARTAIVAAGLVAHARAGTAVVLQWGPQGGTGEPSSGELWTDVRGVGGGGPAEAFGAVTAVRRALPPGSPVDGGTVDGVPAVLAVRGSGGILLVNRSPEPVDVRMTDRLVVLEPWAVRALPHVG